MKKKLIIFGNGEIAEIANYYFNNQTNYLVSYISFNSNAHGFKIKYSSTNTKSVHTIPCNELINGSINE